MAKNVLLGLIVMNAVVFALVYSVAQDYLLAALALGSGILWLTLEMRGKNDFGTLFFLVFMALAVIGSLKQFPIPVMLLGLSAALAAWDLSRFWNRISGDTEHEIIATLETKHLQKLMITAGAGFLIALVPVFIQISINFVLLLLMLLVTTMMLRRSMLLVRKDR